MTLWAVSWQRQLVLFTAAVGLTFQTDTHSWLNRSLIITTYAVTGLSEILQMDSPGKRSSRFLPLSDGVMEVAFFSAGDLISAVTVTQTLEKKVSFFPPYECVIPLNT